jgi:hypothetical protein
VIKRHIKESIKMSAIRSTAELRAAEQQWRLAGKESDKGELAQAKKGKNCLSTATAFESSTQ